MTAHIWGNTTYPVEYAYDACGRRQSMKTMGDDLRIDQIPFRVWDMERGAYSSALLVSRG